MTAQIPLLVLDEQTKFVCVEDCARCCHDIVHLLPNDLKRLSDICNIWDVVIFRPDVKDRGKIVKGENIEGVMTLKQVNDACIFLDDRKCAVYEYRPLSCRMYPFDPLIVQHRDNTFDVTVRTDNGGCVGLGCGEKVCHKEIGVLVEKWRKERVEYDKVVDVWNKNTRSLLDFVKEMF